MRKVFIINLLLLATSCIGNVKSDWACPTMTGGKGNCVSIKEADEGNSEAPLIKTFNYLNSPQKIEIKLITPKLSDLKKLQATEDKNLIPESVPQNSKFRTQEKLGRVWFAPYIDSEGNQHSESVVHVIDEESKWVLQK
jgi:type IV conjugative transfer system lipoprotein TraV